MKLYLMQHGKSMSKEENPERPLTEQGKDDVGRVSQWMSQAGIEVAEIWHSAKLRAEESANIAARFLQAQGRVKAVEGLQPNDDVRPIADALREHATAVMLVGHLPFLSRLSSFLITGDSDLPILQFEMGGIVCLTRQDEKWTLTWMAIPEMITRERTEGWVPTKA